MIYRLQKIYNENAKDLGYCICQLNKEKLYIEEIAVIRANDYFHEFGNAHIGTNILSDVLIDVYFRQNKRFSMVTGVLKHEDARNRNWKKSIPFYRSFPNYINPNLPFSIYFELHTSSSCACRIPDYISPEILIKQYGEKGHDLYFRYIVYFV